MNKINELREYLTRSAMLDKTSKKLEALNQEIEKLNAAIEILDNPKDPLVDALCKRWDVMNKKAAVLKVTVKQMELELANYELKEAFAE